MNVELFNFSKRFNSTKAPTSGSGTTFSNVQLKDDTSIYAPVLLFAVSSFSVPTIAPTLYNYAVIAKFQRNYFIEDWTYRGNVWEAQLTIDVLGTYKTSIGLVSTMIDRSYTSYDGNLSDTKYPITTNTQITRVAMNNPFYQTRLRDGSFVVGIVGEPILQSNNTPYGNNIGSINYYALEFDAMSSLCDWLFDDDIWNLTGITDISNGLFKTMFNPMQYIVSCVWMPYSAYTMSSFTAKPIKVGYWTTTINGYPVNTYMYYDTIYAQIPDHPQIARGAYLNFNPYTKVTAYLPVFGSVPVDMSFRTSGSYVGFRIKIDVRSGQADCRGMIGTQNEIVNGTADASVFYTSSGMFGVPIQLSQALTEVFSSQGFTFSDILNPYANMIKGIGAQWLAGVLGADVQYQGNYPSVSSVGSNGSFLVAWQSANMIVEHFKITEEDRAEFGRPLLQVKTINTLSGYIKCADAHIDLPITDKEKKAITEFMNSGFFYE